MVQNENSKLPAAPDLAYTPPPDPCPGCSPAPPQAVFPLTVVLLTSAELELDR